MINFRLQRYGENPDGTILKNECFTVGTCRVPNETRLARSRYLLQKRRNKLVMLAPQQLDLVCHNYIYV